MFPLFSPRTLGALLSGALLLALTLVAQQHRLFERLLFNVQSQLQAESRQARSLWLPSYRVTVEARPIGEGITDVSALSFDPDRRTLVSVTNKPARFLELDLDGRLLRQVELRGFSDPEAIEYIKPGVYMISEERRQRLVRVRIGADTRVVDVDDRQVSHPFSLSDVQSDNRGNEGLAYDAARERFFVAKESDPVRIYEIDGLGSEAFEGLQALSLRTDPQRDRRLFVRDLSSLQFDPGTGHLLALSDQSRLVLELDDHGKPISSLSLLRGQHGLSRSVPQAEGVAMDDQGRLYVVSEPNLFYRFEKP